MTKALPLRPYVYRKRDFLRGPTPLSWEEWRKSHDGFKRSGSKQQERWQLTYLHSIKSLGYIARHVSRELTSAGKPAGVSIQSVWIDGTPQVKGFLPSGNPLAACELADLLFIVNHTDRAGTTLRRTGLLVQGKTGKRHNALPSNHSTKKERLLLEGLDRTRPLSVYRDTQTRSLLGDYIFGKGSGLADCARYLVMAKNKQWQDCPICNPLEPLQVGWPTNRASATLQDPMSFICAMLEMSMGSTLGRPIQDRANLLGCEWSRMVWDLLGSYDPVVMQGYGRQRRVYKSGIVSFLSMQSEEELPPPSSAIPFPEGLDTPPAISVIQLNVRDMEIEEVKRGFD